MYITYKCSVEEDERSFLPELSWFSVFDDRNEILSQLSAATPDTEHISCHTQLITQC